MPAAVELDSLTKKYGRLCAVDDLSLRLGPGTVYGLFGPNGSGKTTTLECTLGLQRPTRGSVRVLGEPAHRLHRLSGRVAAVFDTPAFVNALRVDENLEYSRRFSDEAGGRSADEVLALVGAADLKARRAGKLSLGQRKRVAVARALLGSPELLVLDEPLSGLDTFGVRRMLELLKRLANEGITLLLSSHRLREMESVVTHVGILSKGRLVREGTLQELLENERTLQVQVRGVEAAERALRAHPGIAGFERLGTQHEANDTVTLRVRMKNARPEDVNRSLVEAGAAVSELVYTGGSLDAIFDQLLREERPDEGHIA